MLLVRCPRCEGTCSIDYLRRHLLGSNVTLSLWDGMLHVVRAVFIGVVVHGCWGVRVGVCDLCGVHPICILNAVLKVYSLSGW